MDNFGLTIEPSPYGPRGVIARPEQSFTGNIILRAGNEHEAGWSQSVYVVMTPDEAMELIARMQELLQNPRVTMEDGRG